MTNNSLHQIMTKIRSIILVLSVFIAYSIPRSVSATAAFVPTSSEYTRTITPALPASVKLYGWIKDQTGNPIHSAIHVMDNDWKTAGDPLTDGNGYYEVTVTGSERLSVMATPLGIPENMITLTGGSQVSKYFELTKTIVPASDSIEVSFIIPPAAALTIAAYSPAGDKFTYDTFNEEINPSGFYGYQGVYGVFPMNDISIPVPAEASIGMLKAVSDPQLDRSLWEPFFAVPPREAVFLMMLWEVPGIGTIPLRADNHGQGYTLADGEVQSINLVYEFAETENRWAQELKAGYEAQGYQFSSEVNDWLTQASAKLNEATNSSNDKDQALLSYEVLSLSIKAKEKMTLEAADKGIEARKSEQTIVVQDEAGNPVPNANVTYNQGDFDFVLGYAQGAPYNPFPYPSLKAGIDIGYESLYGVVVWSKVSPQKGVFDFSSYDAAFKQWMGMGYDVTACLVWLGPDNVPAWAQNLPFAEFKQQVAEFVKQAVEHFTGTVKFLNIAVESELETISGSRYVSAELASSYLTGVQPAELIELIQTVFQAARSVNSDMLFGYYGVADYTYNELNPFPFGAWPVSYSFFKSVLESGVRPDYIGIETYPGTATIPLDLSTVAAMLQAYHDLSGLPVLVTETISYPSRAEDYGVTGPSPNVYWHGGMTESTQAEWDTSFFKIAMGLPFVLGVQMFRDMPDTFPGSPREGTGDGTDSLTNDYQPKQVFYAMKDLIASWRAGGTALTDVDGKVKFNGLGGTYSIWVTTADGLVQTFETHLGPEPKVTTLKLDRTMAITDLQNLVAQAQRMVDWSQGLDRTFDYASLNSQISQAVSSMSLGKFGEANTTAQNILDTLAIRIDGNPEDWSGIQPIIMAAQGGETVNTPGIDLKALYGISDGQYLYLMLEVYDPPITLQPGGIIGSVSYPQFLFDLKTDRGQQYELRTYLPYSGQMDVYHLSEPTQLLGTLYSLAHGNVLELKAPLELLDNPSHVSVCGFVMAVQNGEEKGVKVFDKCGEVSVPVIITTPTSIVTITNTMAIINTATLINVPKPESDSRTLSFVGVGIASGVALVFLLLHVKNRGRKVK